MLLFHVQFLAGDLFARACVELTGLPFKVKVFKGLQEQLAGRKNNNIRMFSCNGADLCNGNGAGQCNGNGAGQCKVRDP
jgi:hypothetical protein